MSHHGPVPAAAAQVAGTPALPVWRQYYELTKPRVVQLIVFCALIGMVLAVPGLPDWAALQRMLVACAGIWLVAGAAAAFNCLIEKKAIQRDRQRQAEQGGEQVVAVGRVSEVIGPLPQIAPKKHGVAALWQSGRRCRGRPM